MKKTFLKSFQRLFFSHIFFKHHKVVIIRHRPLRTYPSGIPLKVTLPCYMTTVRGGSLYHMFIQFSIWRKAVALVSPPLGMDGILYDRVTAYNILQVCA